MEGNPLKSIEEKLHSMPWYGWAGAVAAGGTIFYFVMKKRAAATTATNTANQSAVGTSPGSSLTGFDVSSMAGLPYGYTSDSGMPLDNFPVGQFSEIGVNGSQVPYLPSNVHPVYDANGDIVGYQEDNPPAPTPTPTPTPTPAPVPGAPQPGSIFKGPTGVWHYMAVGGQTLRQIASQLGLKSWNSIYAIPDNQKEMGKLSPQQAANYKPPAGMTITIPQPGSHGSGGRSDWQMILNRGRNTIDQHAVSFDLLN